MRAMADQQPWTAAEGVNLGNIANMVNVIGLLLVMC
jgi:hypothetical protein